MTHRFRDRRAAIVLMVVSLATPLAPPCRAQGAPRTSVVRLNLDTAYDDSPRSLRTIAALVRRLPPVIVELNPGSTLSQLILDTYGVSTFDPGSPSYLPETYKLLERTILEWNHWDSPAAAHAGPLRVPSLPRKALTAGNPANVANDF